MMNARRAETDLGDLETLPFFANQVRPGNTCIVEGEFADRGGVILTAHPAQRPDQADAGRIHRHNDTGMAAGALRIRIGHAEYDQETAARMGGAGDEPFAPVDDVVVLIANDRGGDIGRIGGGHIGFGHPEGRTGLGFEQRPQPARLLF